MGEWSSKDRIWFIATNTNSGRIQTWTQREVLEQSNTKRQAARFINDVVQRNATNTDNLRQHQCECINEINANKRGVNALNDFDANVRQGTSFNSNRERFNESISTNIVGQFPNKESINEVNLLPNGRRRKELSFERFPTQSPICGRNDGISTQLDGITFSKWRQESIKGYGNAIVPQVAYEIFKVINQMHYD